MEKQDSSREPQGEVWRERFISLGEDICKLRGQPAVTIINDPDKYLSLETGIDGVAFEVLHFPDAMERLVVHCRIGLTSNTAAHDFDVLERALLTNMPLALSHTGMFALDTDTDELVYSTAESLRNLSAEQLMQGLAAMASVAGSWQRNAYADPFLFPASSNIKETALDAVLPARRDFINLASQALAEFDADLTPLDAPQLRTNNQVGIKFAVSGIDFALVHFLDPQIDGLVLVKCAFGPLPTGEKHEARVRLLAANYELSTLFLTGFAIDEDQNATYTHSCVMASWNREGLVRLIEGMATLAMAWRNGGILNVDGFSALVDARSAFPPVFA